MVKYPVYNSISECVRKNQDKADPEVYCALLLGSNNSKLGILDFIK